MTERLLSVGCVDIAIFLSEVAMQPRLLLMCCQRKATALAAALAKFPMTQKHATLICFYVIIWHQSQDRGRSKHWPIPSTICMLGLQIQCGEQWTPWAICEYMIFCMRITSCNCILLLTNRIAITTFLLHYHSVHTMMPQCQ